jgi:serine/threonine protein phosphatase PrpC
MGEIDLAGIETASGTDVGRVRSVNQDRCAEFQVSDGARLLVLADGMGGHAGGEHASRIAVETIGEVFQREYGAAEATLRRAFNAANEAILQEARDRSELHGMGTTTVALLISPSGTFTANVGDSRAYRVRGEEIELLTEDHSIVFEEVRSGRISPAEARTHPLRNRLLRCLGIQPGVVIDVEPVAVEPGDRFLLCSDGLWGELEEGELRAVVSNPRPADAIRTLIDRANESGGEDNITAQIAAVPPL